MKCYLFSADGMTRLMIFDAIPVCGDFCDTCGDCLHCYDGDGCMVNGEWDSEGAHYWVIYSEDIPEFMEKHAVSDDTAGKLLTISGRPPPIPSVGWAEFVGGPCDGERRELMDYPPRYYVMVASKLAFLSDVDVMEPTVPIERVAYDRQWFRGWIMKDYVWVWAEWHLYVLPGSDEPYPAKRLPMP